MADLEINVHGDSHGAQDALHGVADAGGHAHDSMHDLKEKLGELKESFTVGALAADAFEKGLEALKEGLAESWAEAAKAENAERQLAAVAGDLTKEFKEQAEAIGANLAMKAEDIEHMQTMLLRYGAAPDVIGKAVEAVQNFATATGQDANAALMMMIRGVEAGHGSLGRMGVQFQATGDFATDLGRAVDAVNGKFGGAAETEAGGMSGRARAASNAVDELKKAIGGLFGAIEQKLGILSGLAAAFNELAKSGSLASAGIAGGVAALWGPGKATVPTVEGENPLAGGGGVDVSFGKISLAPTDKAIADQRRQDDAYSTAEEKLSEHLHRMAHEQDEFDIDQDNKSKERVLKNIEAMDKLDAEAVKGFEKLEDDHTKDLQKLGELQFDMLKQQTDKQAEEMKKREKMWENVGIRISEALINGILSAFSDSSSGGKDWTKTAIPIIQGVFGILADVVGLGGFTSSLFGAANSFGGSSGSTQHAGGWPRRYHDGGWAGELPATLLEGERVLSRGEVSRMGGRQGVDAAARGGGGGGNVIYAMDAESMLEMLSDRMGRSMLNTVRLGRGPLAEMFGGR